MRKGSFGVLLCFFIPAIIYGQMTSSNITIARYKSDKACAISFTFDDGMMEHYSIVFPRLEALGFKGTFWINGSFVPETFTADGQHATWSHLKEMALKGHEISNHGWSHKNLTKCTLEEALIEIGRNDSIIEANIGERPITFCYPYNSRNEEIVKMASKNRVGTRTEQFAIGQKSTSENLKEKISTLITDADWGVAMIHGITYGYDAFSSANILWEHFEYVKSLEEKIWVGTFREVSAYIAIRESTSLQTTRKGNKWILEPSCTLDKSLFKEPLSIVVLHQGIQKMSIKQNGKIIHPLLYPDKAVFDIDPYGGKVNLKIN